MRLTYDGIQVSHNVGLVVGQSGFGSQNLFSLSRCVSVWEVCYFCATVFTILCIDIDRGHRISRCGGLGIR